MFVEVVKFVVENIMVDIIDINMGCLVNKIIKCEVGVKWLFDLNKVYDMVVVVVDVVDKLVIVKMCIGWDEEYVFVIENVFVVECVGVVVVVMYGCICV